MRSRVFSTLTDLIFQKLKAMSKKKIQSIEQDMVFELDLDGLGSIKMDMEPHEVEAGMALIKRTVARLVPLKFNTQTTQSPASTTLLSTAVNDYRLGQEQGLH